MKPDTLFLSGGGVNCIAFLGSFKYLMENKIIDDGFKNIKNIVCVSGSAFYILPLLLGCSLNVLIKICMGVDNDAMVDFTSFDLNEMFQKFGLYENNFIDNMSSVILKHYNLSEKLTLKELHDRTAINLVLKTTNISKYSIEYINHISNPELSVIDAIKMTTCFPLLFQPINYNGNLYVDGGLCGNYPIEYNRTLKSKNYLGIHIKVKDKETDVNNIFSYLNRLQMAPTSPYDSINKKRKNTILIIVDELGTVFKKTHDENMKILINGYLSCKTYFKHNQKYSVSHQLV